MENNKKSGLSRLFTWEFMLVVVLILICLIFNARDASLLASGANKKDIFNFANVIKGLRPYFLYSFMTLGIMLVLAMGEIDISTGALAAFSVAVLGSSYQAFGNAGLPASAAFILAILSCLLVGVLCGMLNGLLVTQFKELYSMIITLATQLFFRGFAYLILGGGTLSLSDDTFGSLKQLYATVKIGNVKVPVMLFIFLAVSIFFYFWIQKTATGRRIFSIGENREAALYSGVQTKKIMFWVFALCGLMSAVTGIFFVGATSSSIKADSMVGYEMYAIAAAVLGGFSTSGGKGNVLGVVLSLIIFGVMKIGLGTLFGFADSMVNMAVGLILIISTLLPNLLNIAQQKMNVRRQRSQLESQQ